MAEFYFVSFGSRTNLQMVQILKLFAGTNDILGTVGQNVQLERHENVHRYVINETTGEWA